MIKNFEKNSKAVLLYLDTRELPLERKAEIRAAHDQGYKILLATPNPKAYRGYAIDYILETNIANYDEAQSDILAYINANKLKIVGIIAWKDREVVLAARLGGALSLLCSSLVAVENVRNKVKTRAVLDQFPGLNPRYAVVKDQESFLSALSYVGVPCVLKQAGNSGSRGMRTINSQEDALSVYDEFLTYNKQQKSEMYHYYNDVALLEEQLIGSEHSVAGIVANGTVITLGIADKKFDRTLPLQYENIIPSKLPAELQREIVNIVQKIVGATGINWVGFHVDFMVTQAGIKILEIGGRLGGEMINSHLIPLAQPGINPYKILIDVVQGRNPLTHHDYTQSFSSQAASRVLMPSSEGTLMSIEGIEKLCQSSYCREYMQSYGVGVSMVTPDVKFKAYEIGYFIAQCAANENMDEVISELVNLIKIKTA